MSDSLAPLSLVHMLPIEITMVHYHYSVPDTLKGIKKSKHRDSIRLALNQDLPSQAEHSRAYCGNHVIQVFSRHYDMGCDYESIERFRNHNHFFTNQDEIRYISRHLNYIHDPDILCVLWGLKEALTKLLNLPLHILLSSQLLLIKDDRMYVRGSTAPIFVYIEHQSSRIAVVTYCERKSNDVQY